MSIIIVLIYKDFSQLRIIYIMFIFFFLIIFWDKFVSARHGPQRNSRAGAGAGIKTGGGGQKFGRKGEGPPHISTPLPYDTGSCGRDKN